MSATAVLSEDEVVQNVDLMEELLEKRTKGMELYGRFLCAIERILDRQGKMGYPDLAEEMGVDRHVIPELRLRYPEAGAIIHRYRTLHSEKYKPGRGKGGETLGDERKTERLRLAFRVLKREAPTAKMTQAMLFKKAGLSQAGVSMHLAKHPELLDEFGLRGYSIDDEESDGPIRLRRDRLAERLAKCGGSYDPSRR